MRLFYAFSVALLAAAPCGAYSALSHEAIVDSSWEMYIRPLLLEKFPNATAEELKEAHAYVYGGCLVQDMGYFPFASHLYSDLVHYTRSGEYVMTLLRDAETLDEMAFALGGLAHYTSDVTGHPTVNKTVGRIYPKLRAKYGEQVTYEDDRGRHLKTEFAFDVVQVARQSYAPDAYHDFIGFKVSKPLLERAFLDTYGIELKEIFHTLDLGIGTYRFTMGNLIPTMTKAAWDSKRKDIEKLSPGVTRSKYLYSMRRQAFEKEWGAEYQKPGIGARFLALMFRVVPKFGPFKVLAFRAVPPEAEKEFLASFDATVAKYRQYLADVKAGRLHLENYNLDTGVLSRAGDYKLADEANRLLAEKIASKTKPAQTAARP